MTTASAEREPPVVIPAAKWRVGERQVPRSRHELSPRALAAKETHPLALATTLSGLSVDDETAAVAVDPPLSSASSALVDSFAARRGSGGVSPELVVLQDGDVDPLGVLGALTEAKVASTKAARSEATPVDAANASDRQSTVKHKWKGHTERLLAKYADHTFRIKTSMLEVNDLENEISFAPMSDYQKADDQAEASVIKKTRARLEQLERGPDNNGPTSEQDEKTIEISQSQYVAKVKEMEKRLISSWEQNHKVEALRIAIKCVKLLADTDTAPQLYPCVFVLVSEVLDAFGKLVFDRIYARASEDENGQPLPEPLGENFMSSDVNVQATETCRNWFYKTACIRELLPRIYIEIALIGCYRFLCDGEYPQIVARLSNMLKGVGEPMVALYARLYLALASSELLGTTSPSEQAIVVSSSLFDYFYAFNWFRRNKLEHWLLTHKMEHDEYLALHSPAVEWLVKCAAPGATQDSFDTLLAHYQEYSDSSMVLKHLCECFGAKFYASTPTEMLELIRVSSPSLVSKCHLYSLVAVQLSNVPVIAENEPGGKLQFLNDSWSSITSQENITQYMECAAAYMKLIVVHFSHREALILLKDVVRHLNSATPEELTAKTYNLLGALIENVVFGAKQHYEFFSKLIPSASFLALMGMFKRESSVDVAKKVLRAFVSGSMKKSSNRSGTLRLHVVGPEAAVAHTLLVVCCRVHDALDSLSTASERAEANRDISAFITRLGYVNETANSSERAQDEEQEALLMLYTDCRRSFYKLEPIKELLSTMVLRLAMHVHKRTGGGVASVISGKKRMHARRNFIQSCLAFAHITIPSIEAPLEKLQLMVSAANVALVTSCIPQMDALVKAAIVLLAELDPSAIESVRRSDEDSDAIVSLTPMRSVAIGLCGAVGIDNTSTVIDHIVQVIAQLMSLLVYAPSLNDEDPFYFVSALRKAVLERLEWIAPSSSSVSRRLEAGVARVRVLLMLVQLYGLWGQRKLPDRLDGVDSNDVLYGGDDTFYNEVQTRFSSTVEEVAREIEGMGDAVEGNNVESGARVEHLEASQVELMLDFVNLVVPVLEYDESRLEDAPTTADSFRVEEAGTSRSASRRRKKPRSGAALVRKCMAYSHEKAQSLKQAKPRETSTRQLQITTWICRYFDSTRAYVTEFMSGMPKRAAGVRLDASSQQAVQALAETLNNLAL
ncbi:hypothetical protein PF005_g10494 [Phytophthora fragariae]|uniref:Uncharacterized protein n=1 Tax=Phytophthora fragariae TaxID=53985 RepID=A0A6A3Y5Q6_9STRA|nr:hypothetical protein PF003_g19614 [Phytophthora fragariae]KAE8938536.1 hypothetical protein PF009_g11581 [Phytophthora fragariae]KAE9113472.1 hypothetical protein PF007_g10734 [Phytophthora fragariae]KAE9145235.1 hypothetical protein PF006_g9888 [Phytophthora fragariae]KAE9212669.1 hypothetical protein PF005_g10494 [Phytophthora fragariae]